MRGSQLRLEWSGERSEALLRGGRPRGGTRLGGQGRRAREHAHRDGYRGEHRDRSHGHIHVHNRDPGHVRIHGNLRDNLHDSLHSALDLQQGTSTNEQQAGGTQALSVRRVHITRFCVPTRLRQLQ